MEKIKIYLFSKENKAGLNTFFRNISNLNSEFELSLFLYKKESQFSGKLNLNTIYIDKSSISKFNFVLINIYKYIIHLVKTFLIIYQKKPDIICANDTYSILVILVLSPLFIKTSSVAIIHSDVLQALGEKIGERKRIILLKFYAFLIGKADKVIFVSEGTRKDYLKCFTHLKPKKTKTIYYGIELPAVRPEKKRVVKNHIWSIVTVGRFERQKDFQTIIECIYILRKKQKVELNIIGKGDLINSYKKLVKKLNLDGMVNFLGWMDQNKIYQELRKSDIFVFSSFYETFGIVIIEALACGIPIVATDTKNGPRESLESGKYGLIVPVGDSRKVAMAVEKLILSKELRQKLIRAGLIRAQDFSTHVMTGNYKQLFKSLLPLKQKPANASSS